MDLQGAKPARIGGYRPQEGRANYFVGNRDQWITGIPLYAGVQYTEVYPGVDLVFYVSEGELEYDFTLALGASASTIHLGFRGIDEMRIDGGDLVLKTGWGELRHRRPHIYQMKNGRKSEIGGRFVIRGKNEAGFETDPYDTGSALVIDPVMAYSTYIGGSGNDAAWAVAVDSAGSAYVVGETWSANFPKTFTISNLTGNGDAFVVKMNPSGTAVVYATYFGGTGGGSARGVAVDAAGNAYVTGFTYSSDFPATAGAYRSPSLGQADAFAIKVNPSGSALLYSALIGGAGPDFATGIAVDASGNAYIAGYTSSVAFPVTSGAFQTSYGGGIQDAFVAKLNSSGSALVYCTYLGGAGNDLANGIAVDAAGEAYIVGYTDSINFPTHSPIYASAGGEGDAFVAKLTAAGGSLEFSTYLGGSLSDLATAVALDSSGNVYVTGATLSTDFPVTAGAFQTVNQGSYDAFVSKMNSQGSSILYSTFIGGEGSDESSGIGVDTNGVAYIAGFTYSSHFPVLNPLYSATSGGEDAFVVAVGAAGASLVWSTYLGGAANDQATGIAVSSAGTVYVTGSTFSTNFPTTSGAYRSAYAGDGDAFLTAIEVSAPVPVSVSPSSGSGATQTFTFTAASGGGYRNIASVQITVANTGASCSLDYTAPGSISINNDSGSGLAESGTLGGSGTIQNSECSLNLAASSVVGASNNLTLTLAITFKSGLQGLQNIYMSVGDNAGLVSSRQQMGTWTAPVTQQGPVNVSVSPSSGTGTTQTFTFTAASSGGYHNIANVLATFSSGGATCYLNYVAPSTVYINADSGEGWGGSGTLGGSGTIQNAECSLNLAASSLAGSANTLTLNLAVTFKSGLQGQQSIYMAVIDNAGLTASWQLMGSWNIPAVVSGPANVSLSPSSGTGTTQTFTFTAASSGGYRNIANVLATFSSGGATCYLNYVAPSTVYINADSGGGWGGSGTLGGSGTIQNAECSLNLAASSLAGSANTLTLNLAVTFKSGLQAQQSIYMAVVDNAGLTAPWQLMGTWTQ